MQSSDDDTAPAGPGGSVPDRADLRFLSGFPDGVCLDRDGIVLWANPAFRTLYGFAPDQPAEGARLADLVEDDTDQTLSTRLPGAGLGGHRSWKAGRRRDGSTFPLELTTCRAELSGEMVAMTVHRDVLTARNARRSERLASLGMLAGGIAHEFNNILTGILLHSRILRQKGGEGAHGSADAIESLSKRGAGLVRRLVDFSRADGGAAVLVDLVPLVREAANRVSLPDSPARRVEVEVDPEAPVVLADPASLRIVCSELLRNAAAALAGAGRIGVRLRRATLDPEMHGHPELRPGDFLALDVEDDGRGIAPEAHAHLFDPFFTTGGGGTPGLGLAAVHGIVRQHSGFVEVTSRPGATRFTVYLPSAAEAGPDAASGRSREEAPRPLTVLYADDEEALRDAVGELIRCAGHEVILASGGQEAVERFAERAGKIDAVLLDLRMPGMGGEEAFRNIRELDADVPVFFVSGTPAEDVVERCRPLRLSGVLEKPFEPSRLERLLAAAGRRR